ncbi:MAG TPA: tyrosine-type recombinase/integrase [Rhodocyclaceae bacterium]|nr:tyrosine-type recombinase/integrase [Rhodocyclaceae bacterium]HUX24256.1 tyrosine-type recombinase/integrase [Burkholderiales bacterium]
MLTDTEIRNAKAGDKPLKLKDSNGLYLEVRPNGSKLWRYRYKINDKENLFAVGDYCQPPAGESDDEAKARREGRRFTLSEARVERERCRGLVKQGIHPSHSQRTEKLRRSLEAANTFKAVAEAWITENKSWSDNYRRQIVQRFAADAYPHIGALPIRDVTPAHVKDVLKRVQKRGAPASAKLLRTWIGGVCRYAAGELLLETDPTWPLRFSIKAPATQHIQHLTAKEIPAFLQAIERVQAEHATTIAAKLLWLTVVRTVELRCAEWQEFDLEAGLWTVPAARMKMRKVHAVPLSRQAIELLRAIQPLTGRGRFVFPGRKDRERPLTHEAIRDVFNRAGYAGKFTPHGVRSTFSTYFNEANVDSELIELTLAHKDKDVIRGAYNHAKKMAARRELLQQWADLADAWRQGATVVPIQRSAA